MSMFKQLLLTLAFLIISIELALAIYFYHDIGLWLSHHIWLVLLPFSKVLIKRVLALKVVAFFNVVWFFLWHCIKLMLIKFLKTIGLRYGLFFSQYRWRTVRLFKLIFLRKGKQFFRMTARFWAQHTRIQKCLLLVAFFPIALTLFILGLSFNITRKTMVQKTQEAAMVKVATTASQQSRGAKAWIERLDRKIIAKIKQARK